MSNSFGKGGQVPAGQTTTTQTPPSYMYPYIGTALSQAGDLLGGNGPQDYPGQTVAGFSQPQQQAFARLTHLDKNLMQGSGNPYEDAMFSRMAGATQNQLSGEFAGMGRNAAASEPLRAEQLNNLATGFYGGQYQNDVNNALTAGQNLLGVGNQVQQEAQNQINANMAKYNYYQQLPYQQLQRYEQFLQGINPGSQSSTPYFTNPTANALSAAEAVQQLYKGYQGKGGTTPASTASSG
ncbi:MAG TPA: hypothetical protein VLV87_08680 [Gammaproteobacteria bacterium]|nr:hypothetical protein [Gammaproteobacteria bacterium]